MDGLDALKRMSSRPFDAIQLDLVLPNVDGWQFRAATPSP
jgi:CheY-like chemotaxis protein